ncbi:MAG: AAA family ATPase [Schwartzia sp.]|nr:AAA family ATPase [Schwartzia sp. (in: firmicutes)]
MDSNAFTWIGFYEAFANRLLSFKENRTELFAKIRAVYQRAGIPLPTLDKDNNVTDMDPFTVFGLFNKGLSDANRIKLAESIKNEFSIAANAPKDFKGIPVLNNMAATFYRFQGERDDHDIDNLWQIFESAILLADADIKEHQQSFMTAYDVVRQQNGIRWNLTMGLYWIRPNAFISFDSRNREYIKAHIDDLPNVLASLSDSTLPDAKTYLTMRDALLDVFANGSSAYRNFPEFSLTAWEETQNQPLTDNAGAVSDTLSVGQRPPHYWLYSPGHGAEKWNEFYNAGIMGLGWDDIGDLSTFASKEAMIQEMKSVYGEDKKYTNAAHATWQFSHEMKPGDIVFAKRGRLGEILGRGVVKAGYAYDDVRAEYKNVVPVEWTHNEPRALQDKQLPMKTLTDITPYSGLVAELCDLFTDDAETEEDAPAINYEPYTQEDFLREVFISREQYDSLAARLKKKKNIILQGAPGVGKTFIARRLAYSMMGVRDNERVMMVQFHQSYSYEDFIMGYRPTDTGFQVKTGAFYNFCKKAGIDNENDYFFIIDEINRGNLNKIFGELFLLLEADKRGEEVKLLYKDEMFSVPGNIYLIGTMNTADRSLAMLDYALRRRFSFFDMAPGFKTDGFQAYQKALNNEKFNRLIACVERLNLAIAGDETLGEGFAIGHSYFCGLTPGEVDDKALSAIVEFDVLPLLKEYWFDEPSKVADWSGQLRSALQ